jgi:hypothetical protein
MMHGGNAKARKFFKERGGMLSVDQSQMQQKYYSDVASMYKSQLDQQARAGFEGMISPPSSPKHGPASGGIGEVAKDFFDLDDKKLQRSGSDGALCDKPGSSATSVKRSSSAGTVGAAAATTEPAALQQIQELARTAVQQEMSTGSNDDAEWGEEAAFTAPDAQDTPAAPVTKSVKVIQAKARPGIGKGKAKKTAVKAKPTAVKVSSGDGSAPTSKKASKADDWGDMDSFDDAKWESIKSSSAKAEADANKPKTLVFDAPKSNGMPAPGATTTKADDWDDFGKEEPSIQIVDKNWNKGKKAAAAAAAKKQAEADAEDFSMRQQYAGARSISSDQVHGTDDSEPKNYDQFYGQTSLGSDQYFGRGSSGGGFDDDEDLDGLVNNLAEETRRDLRVVGSVLKDKGRQAAAMAGQFISNLSDRYG